MSPDRYFCGGTDTWNPTIPMRIRHKRYGYISTLLDATPKNFWVILLRNDQQILDHEDLHKWEGLVPLNLTGNPGSKPKKANAGRGR